MPPLKLLRRPQLRERTGEGKSTSDNRIRDGLLTPAIRLGPRLAAWPEHEIDAIVAARIAGKTDDEIRALVQDLVRERKNLPTQLGR
jgi:prophage regulatory protein